ncbi:MAG: hypothetical protein KC544_04885 [Gemmatimonadetes bacterium]|nr:hypothetical protein [Gemmatimonadota bacterium]
MHALRRLAPRAALVGLVLLAACGGDSSPGTGTPPPPPPPPPPGGGAIDLGLGGGGGTTRYERPGDPYDGLTLTAPAGALPAAASWSFRNLGATATPALPAGYRALGPILQVSTETPRASAMMTLEIPVAPAANEDVVIVFRDPARGVLEVMPTIARTATSIRVMTSHLRGDLILGPASPASIRLGGSVTIGQLIPVAFLIPQQPAGPVLPQGARWPVLDHGSVSFPDGFGAAIPALQALAAARGAPPFSSVLQAAPQPGFYSDPISFAAVNRVAQLLQPAPGPLVQQLTGALGQLSKPERDELVHRNVQASMALVTAPQILALTNSGVGSPVFANGYASSVAALGLVLSTHMTTVDANRAPSTGFADFQVQSVADGPMRTVNFVVPLSSFTTEFEQVQPVLTDLLRAPSLPRSAWKALATQMTADAGLQPFRMEYQPGAAAAWLALLTDTLVVRTPDVSVRLPAPLGGAGLILTLPGTSELARVEGTPLAIGGLPEITGLIAGISRRIVGSVYLRPLNQLRQATVGLLEVFRTPFEITPDDAEILQPDTQIDFTADVAPAPDAGYYIRWEWGDSTTTELLSINTASHTFQEVRDHQVIATMLSSPGREVLAVDTVMVGANPAPYWHIISFTDQDGLLEDNEGTGDLVFMLERLVASPRSGVLVIDSVGPGEKALRMHVNVLSEWDPNICCPLQPASVNIYTLGTDPGVGFTVGPFFLGYGLNYFSQSTTNLNAGTLMSQWIPNTVTYNIAGGGSQVGPAGAIRISATRTGVVMAGELTVHLWFFDPDNNEVSGPPEIYRFPFTGLRLR